VATAASLGGIGLGPLAGGLLAQFVRDPLVVPYVVLGSLAVAAAVLVQFAPETVRVIERPRYHRQRISLPSPGRARFVAGTLGYRSHALAGAVAFLVFAAGAVAQSLLARLDARRLAGVGVGLLPVGLALLTVATWRPSLPAFVAGGVLAGAGAGVLFKGGINTVLELAPRDARAETLAGFFLAAYLGLSAPIIGLGLATQYVSARVGLLAFSGVLVAAVAVLGRALVRAEPRAVRALRITEQGGRA
jgi:MFS family permease